ncbi:MAG: putative molybdenum carrier protein [Gammaproteobacteria bacterium]|nr:putative molybdenum carrier protein [Gammaproteobacteria bacterium]
MLSIKKVISGGQTGADIGSLVGARRVGITTGGYCPNGFKTEKGSQPVLADFGLIEHESSDYAPRTIANVKLADVTIVFNTNAHSPGTEKTLSACTHHGKPHLSIDPYQANAENKVVAFISQHQPAIINIAGHRESQSPGMAARVAGIVERVLKRFQAVAFSLE